MRLRPLLVPAVASLLAFATPSPANPLARNSLGAGAVTGSLACGSSAVATGTVANTVLTGYVGRFSLHATCDPTFTIAVTGDAVTGSTLRCPALTGTYAFDGVTEHVEVVGQCRINNFPTDVRWRIDTGRFTVERA